MYHKKTVHVALEITGALGHTHAGLISGDDVIRRTKGGELRSLSEIYRKFCGMMCIAHCTLNLFYSYPPPPSLHLTTPAWITLKSGSLLDGSAPESMLKIFGGKGIHNRYAWDRL